MAIIEQVANNLSGKRIIHAESCACPLCPFACQFCGYRTRYTDRMNLHYSKEHGVNP